ncbi:hypothetical protein HAX54_033486 [Datura stramonium]|uniref:Uncharacterized protein n=1 Tax=Datura stramonium TaxID=4076 RepID=A0ABS8VF24_DATST|nr:hypothetical protein [Datura stramonium]
MAGRGWLRKSTSTKYDLARSPAENRESRNRDSRGGRWCRVHICVRGGGARLLCPQCGSPGRRGWRDLCLSQVALVRFGFSVFGFLPTPSDSGWQDGFVAYSIRNH